jgi:hypothetical protein
VSANEYQSVEDAFRDGTVEVQDSQTLGKFLLALANQVLPNEFVRHRDIIRGFTINHILLQRHIAALDKKNARMTALVVVLAIASLVGTASQTWYGYKADKRYEAEPRSADAKGQQQRQAENQSSAALPNSRQASTASAASTPPNK